MSEETPMAATQGDSESSSAWMGPTVPKPPP